MSLRSLNEGFEVSYFNLLRESTLREIDFLLSRLNEAGMSDEDRRDSQILRQIRSKANSVEYDKRRALNWTPAELAVANKYNLTLPQKKRTYNGVVVTPMKDNDVDYERGHGRNIETRNLDRDIQQARGVGFRRDANLADFIRKRKTKGPRQDRPYREADKYARVDDEETFGDTTFTHDNSGRFGRDSWDEEHGRAPSLAGSRKRNADLTDVEKDRVRVNKQMSQPVKAMKKALGDRADNQADLDNVSLEYARNVADARRRFDDAMAYADEQRQRSSERGQAGVADANKRINQLLKKESFEQDADEDDWDFEDVRYGDPFAPETPDDYEVIESFDKLIKEKLDSLNEAEMSDEDKHDTEILKQIYLKTQQRANAALTPEEKEILKKYNLARVPWNKNVHTADNVQAGRLGGPIFQKRDFENTYDRKTFTRRPPKADKINYADMARKRPEREGQAYRITDRDYWDMRTPDYEAEHEQGSDDDWDPLQPDTYQKKERRAENQQMYQKVRDMKRALRDRKASQSKVDSADAELQAQLDKLKKEYEDRIAGVRRGHESRTEYSKRDVQRNQDAIDKLLRRKGER